MEAEIPGFTTVVPNCIYERPHPDDESCFEVLVLFRYREPTEDDVYDYIRRQASSYIGLGIREKEEFSQTSNLKDLISKLSADMLVGLEKNDSRYESNARLFCEARSLNEGEEAHQYVHAALGISSRGVGHLEGKSLGVAVALLRESGDYAQSLDVNIKLEKGKLYKRATIDLLMDHKVSVSETFGSTFYFYTQEEMRSLVDIVYDHYSSPAQVALLSDESAAALEEVTIATVEKLYESEPGESTKTVLS